MFRSYARMKEKKEPYCTAQVTYMNKEKLNWYDRKRIWCGLPWTFTKYGFSDDRLFVETGLLTTRLYDSRLYRVTNISVSRTLIQKIFGLGNIHIDTTDKDLGCFDLVNIKNCLDVKEKLSEAVEQERIRNKVVVREYADEDEAFENDNTYSE